MNQRLVSCLLLLAAGAAILLACFLPPRVGHPVTPFMKSSAEKLAGQLITKIPGEADRPMVVIFVLSDCPCSLEYEPYVHRLFQAYRDRGTFIEVVAGDDATAQQWKAQQSTPFPVISDPDGKIAQEFGALRSAYTALVMNGKIRKIWPGYSAGMLRELGSVIANATGGSEQSLDLDQAPDRLTSGCPL